MIEDMREIGRVKLVQIQTDRLTDKGYYDPTPLVTAASLQVTAEGVIGILEDGSRALDVHNAAHPRSRFRQHNALSFGFVGQYDHMRRRFGPHLVDGIAGENVIIDTSEAPDLDALGERIAFHNPATGQTVTLSAVYAMTPCEEFSTFALNQGARPDSQDLKAALQFLSDGTRGYCARPLSFTHTFVIQPGDILYGSGGG